MSNLQSLIRNHGRRQKDLAEHLGVSEPTVSRWAARETDIPVRYIQPIANWLRIAPTDVLAVATRNAEP